jgi:hypothetical protein
MRYDPSNKKHLELLIEHAARDGWEGESCPVDDICDSIPTIVNYLKSLESIIRELKVTNQKQGADIKELERRLNNVKSQKFRVLKKKKMG